MDILATSGPLILSERSMSSVVTGQFLIEFILKILLSSEMEGQTSTCSISWALLALET